METRNTINRVLLRFLQAGEYEILYITNNFAEIKIKNVTLEAFFDYTEADGFKDTDYFNGTGEFVETHPASIDFEETNFYTKENDKLDWLINLKVQEELESIIINQIESL